MKIDDKVSPKQVVFLILTCILATVDVFVPNVVAQYAGRDAWISALAAAAIGFLIYRIILMLCLHFPNLSLAGFNRLLLGKYLGGLVTVVYIISFLVFCAVAMVQFAVIMPMAFKPESSIYLWDLLILLPALYVASLGISVSARMNELLLPLGLLVLLLVVGLNIPEMELKEYLPVFNHGYLPAAKGAFIIGANLAYSILILAILPMINKNEKMTNLGPVGFVLISFILLVGTAAIPLWGPNLTGMMLFPALEMIRNIDIGFLTRLDALMMGMWYTGFFIFIAIFSYAAAFLTRDLFNLKSYKPILWFYGIIIMIIADIKITNVSMLRMLFTWPLAVLLYILGLVIPLLLYMVAKLRGYSRQERQKGSNFRR